MAKKRKSRSSKKRRAQLATQRKIRRSASAPRREEKVSFQEEYRYVFQDLKRMGVLAGAMFVLLVAAALLLS